MITGLYAGILALFFFFLSKNVIKERIKSKTSIGDGGNDELILAIRIHGNFAEYVPLILILLALSEMSGMPIYAVHALGAATVISRVFHFIGLGKKAFKFRLLGMVITFFTIIALGVNLIYSYIHNALI